MSKGIEESKLEHIRAIFIDGYKENDAEDILIDYKNNVHYILQEKQKIDVYRSDI